MAEINWLGFSIIKKPGPLVHCPFCHLVVIEVVKFSGSSDGRQNSVDIVLVLHLLLAELIDFSLPNFKPRILALCTTFIQCDIVTALEAIKLDCWLIHKCGRLEKLKMVP